MVLPSDLISRFAKTVNKSPQKKSESYVYGTVVEDSGLTYVQLDGSDVLTPVSTLASVKNGARVTVLIKDHSATIAGNMTSPAASGEDVAAVEQKLGEFDRVVTNDLEAERARINTLVAENVAINGVLNAVEANIGELQTDNLTVKETLTAHKADIEQLEADNLTVKDTLTAHKADIEQLEADNATINGTLTANEADIHDLQADFVDVTDTLTAQGAYIKDLDAKKLSAEDADIKYANIDFSNIGKAAMEHLFAESGLIRDVVVENGTITGHLVGVTISGDLIEGNTIVAEKLVIKGEDGLYYKLNTDGVTTEAEQTDYNSLNGMVIRAKSVTADKVDVSDLVAFDATIGGFHITQNSIYSGVKESADNTTRGVYMDSSGQFALGDADNFLKYFKDTDETYKLAISAGSILLKSSNKTVDQAIKDMQGQVNSMEDEITTILRIESSKGNIFKNNEVSTVLSAVIYRGSKRITDMAALREVMGQTARLQWSWQKINDATYWEIPANDPRLGTDGFTLTLGPEDVDTKVTFLCELAV